MTSAPTRVPETYDLATPSPVDREAEDRLNAQLESLREDLRLALRRHIRVTASIEIGRPEMVRGRRLAPFCEGRGWWYSGGAAGEETAQTALLGCEAGLVFAAIDYGLGGPGSFEVPDRVPSEIENQLGSRFLSKLFQEFSESLQQVPLRLHIKPHERVREPLTTYLKDAEGPYLKIPFTVQCGEHQFSLLLCLARPLLELCTPKEDKAHAVRKKLSKPLAITRLPLVAELARCRLTVEEVKELRRGDVVLFDSPPGQPLNLRLQGRTKYLARLGTHEGYYAVEVTQVLEPPAGTAPAGAAKPPPAPARPKPLPAPSQEAQHGR